MKCILKFSIIRIRRGKVEKKRNQKWDKFLHKKKSQGNFREGISRIVNFMDEDNFLTLGDNQWF